jgi:hypothetical protein
MAENEVVFRQYNERVRQNFDEIVKEAKQSGQEYLIPEDDTPLHFYCECSDENCRNRIQMKPSLYNEIHQNRSRFIILNGHETNKIEQIVKKEDGYSVVEKYVKPPETARSLSPTGINH